MDIARISHQHYIPGRSRCDEIEDLSFLDCLLSRELDVSEAAARVKYRHREEHILEVETESSSVSIDIRAAPVNVSGWKKGFLSKSKTREEPEKLKTSSKIDAIEGDQHNSKDLTYTRQNIINHTELKSKAFVGEIFERSGPSLQSGFESRKIIADIHDAANVDTTLTSNSRPLSIFAQQHLSMKGNSK